MKCRTLIFIHEIALSSFPCCPPFAKIFIIFRCAKVCLQDRVVCLIFQWLHPKIYLAWRIFWALYHLGWMTYDVWYDVTNNPHLGTWLIYLTNWTFLWLTACCLLDAVAVCYANFTESSAGNQLWQFFTLIWNIYISKNYVKQGAGRPGNYLVL